MRLFFALPLPPDLGNALGRWQCTQPPFAGWSRADGLHLTLAFLGNRPPGDLATLGDLGASVAARHPSFELETIGLGGFPERDRARVLWLGLAPSRVLEALAVDLRSALTVVGEAFDAKAFRPHITLARFRRPQSVGAFSDPPPMVFTTDRLVLFESAPQGCYTALRTWHFRGV